VEALEMLMLVNIILYQTLTGLTYKKNKEGIGK